MNEFHRGLSLCRADVTAHRWLLAANYYNTIIVYENHVRFVTGRRFPVHLYEITRKLHLYNAV